MPAAVWGIVLTVAALVASGFHVRRWRTHRITTLQFAAGMIARVGFIALGLMYVTDVPLRWPRVPIYGLLVVGLGIVLNLLAGIIENIRSSR